MRGLFFVVLIAVVCVGSYMVYKNTARISALRTLAYTQAIELSYLRKYLMEIETYPLEI